MKVMIVDDNERIRRVIKSVLQAQPEFICECQDGAEALQIYDLFKPDWVLMDIQMGGLDGISATERIMKKYPEARVVIVSQFDDDSFRASARDAGAVGFVSKERLYEINDLLVEGAGGVPTQA